MINMDEEAFTLKRRGWDKGNYSHFLDQKRLQGLWEASKEVEDLTFLKQAVHATTSSTSQLYPYLGLPFLIKVLASGFMAGCPS